MNVSDAVIVALIVAFPTTITAVATLWVSVRNSRKLDAVQKATNGMKDALVDATRGEAVAVGKAEGVEGERVRTEAIASNQKE